MEAHSYKETVQTGNAFMQGPTEEGGDGGGAGDQSRRKQRLEGSEASLVVQKRISEIVVRTVGSADTARHRADCLQLCLRSRLWHTMCAGI